MNNLVGNDGKGGHEEARRSIPKAFNSLDGFTV